MTSWLPENLLPTLEKEVVVGVIGAVVDDLLLEEVLVENGRIVGAANLWLTPPRYLDLCLAWAGTFSR